MDKELRENILQLGQKLDMIAALLLRLVPRNIESLSLKEQIRLLDGLGVRPVDIAKIIGRAQGYVGKELVSIRKEK